MQFQGLLSNSSTIKYIFIAFLLNSYFRKPYKILCCFYVLSSFCFIFELVNNVENFVTSKLGVVLGMCVSEVVQEKVRSSYLLTHVGVVSFGALLPAQYGGEIVFPLLFCLMALVSGYKRMVMYSVPTLICATAISWQIGFAAPVALCSAALGLIPFAFCCELFPDEIIEYNPVLAL